MRRGGAVRLTRAVARRPGGAPVRAVSRGCTDRGSATVLGVGVIAVLCAVAGLAFALGQAVIVRHRAAGGADMAALAAADHWAEGTAAACARADRVARAQGDRLVRCVISGEISDLTVASGAGLFAAEARARAGPADAGPGPDPGVGPGPGPGNGLGVAPAAGPADGAGAAVRGTRTARVAPGRRAAPAPMPTPTSMLRPRPAPAAATVLPGPGPRASPGRPARWPSPAFSAPPSLPHGPPEPT